MMKVDWERIVCLILGTVLTLVPSSAAVAVPSLLVVVVVVRHFALVVVSSFLLLIPISVSLIPVVMSSALAVGFDSTVGSVSLVDRFVVFVVIDLVPVLIIRFDR